MSGRYASLRPEGPSIPADGVADLRHVQCTLLMHVDSNHPLPSTRWKRSTPSHNTPKGKRISRWIVRRLLVPLLKWSMVVSLPFAALHRGALYAYQNEWSTGLSLLIGFAAAFLVLFVYATWVYLRLRPTGRAYGRRAAGTKALVILTLLGGLQIYLLLTPDPAHLESPDTATEYTDLHPLLRMGVGTLLLFDDRLLLTDLSRHPSDYDRMGLPRNPGSLHYPQADGYAHALDLRTKGHSSLRNLLTEAYFRMLGFRTLRHVGTADHLHVSLPLPSG